MKLIAQSIVKLFFNILYSCYIYLSNTIYVLNCYKDFLIFELNKLIYFGENEIIRNIIKEKYKKYRNHLNSNNLDNTLTNLTKNNTKANNFDKNTFPKHIAIIPNDNNIDNLIKLFKWFYILEIKDITLYDKINYYNKNNLNSELVCNKLGISNCTNINIIYNDNIDDKDNISLISNNKNSNSNSLRLQNKNNMIINVVNKFYSKNYIVSNIFKYCYYINIENKENMLKYNLFNKALTLPISSAIAYNINYNDLNNFNTIKNAQYLPELVIIFKSFENYNICLEGFPFSLIENSEIM